MAAAPERLPASSMWVIATAAIGNCGVDRKTIAEMVTIAETK